MKDPILFWNDVVMEANRLDHTGAMEGEHQAGPTLSSRATAIVHLAMHDAYFGVAGVASIPGPTPPAKRLYLAGAVNFTGGDSPAKRSAAVSGAAATALITLYSGQGALFEAKSAEIAGENGTDDSAFSYGRRIALAVLATRAGDDKLLPKDEDHMPSPGPARHRKDPLNPGQPYLGVAYGKAQTFAVKTWQAINPPPVKGSAPYLADYTEVRAKGGASQLNTTTRTPDETAIGLYWAYDGAMKIGTPPRLYNQIVRKIAELKNTGPTATAENARLFALINCAMGDSGIHAWHYKYCHDFWRPIIGIREHDQSTGPAATPDPSINSPCDPFWRPLGAPRSNELKQGFTPPFPAYPSGHATFGSSVFEMVRLFYRERDSLPFKNDEEDAIGFSFVSDELDGKTTEVDSSVRTKHHRSYKSMAQAMYDNSVSRVYLGVHWRFDGTGGESMKKMLKATDGIGGVPLGRAIARDIFSSGMQQQAAPPVAPNIGCI